MDKVVHFEIPADDLDRAKNFYKTVFSWKTKDYPDMQYVIAHTMKTDKKQMPLESGAINGGMMKRSKTVKAPTFSINVKSVDKAVEKIKKSGGTILKDKLAVGDMGFMAYFKDTEGNVLSVWENAKM